MSEIIVEDATWKAILADPALANARRKLSFHEIRLIVCHARAGQPKVAPIEKALKAILAEPYGCVFCDSGKLRNPAKDHEEKCGFALAEAALSAPAPPTA